MTREFPIADKATFIFGHPRSGTTMFRGLLDNHPELVVFPNEMKFFRLTMGRYDADTFMRYSDLKLVVGGRFTPTDVDVATFRERLSERLDQANDLRDALLAVMASYAEIEPSRGHSKTRWVEKTPGSYFFAPLLFGWFDDCRPIWLVRDPRTVLRSVRKKHPEMSTTRFCLGYLAYIACLEATRRRRPDRSLVLRYEDLVSRADPEIARVTRYLGIQWSGELEMASVAGQMNDDPGWMPGQVHTRSTKLSGTDVSAEDLRMVERWLGPVARGWGYDVPVRGNAPAAAVFQAAARAAIAFTWAFPASCRLLQVAARIRRTIRPRDRQRAGVHADTG